MVQEIPVKEELNKINRHISPLWTNQRLRTAEEMPPTIKLRLRLSNERASW